MAEVKVRHFVYIVRCNDDSLYTGYTVDLDRRLEEHNGVRKGGAKYTAARMPVVLVYSESYDSASVAKKREYEIKQLSRIQKLGMID